MIHMENKDLHVAIVFSPICGPKCIGRLGVGQMGRKANLVETAYELCGGGF